MHRPLIQLNETVNSKHGKKIGSADARKLQKWNIDVRKRNASDSRQRKRLVKRSARGKRQKQEGETERRLSCRLGFKRRNVKDCRRRLQKLNGGGEKKSMSVANERSRSK
jgi:hypothetical protein